MTIEFRKYHGTGNDFILIDNRDGKFPNNEEVIRQMCDRHFGVGSDGLMLIQNHPEADYEMVFFNPDGSKSLCGNGSRCAFIYARHLGIVGEVATFLAVDGMHRARLDDGEVRIQLKDGIRAEKVASDFYVHTGSPHYIRVVSDLDKVDLVNEGRAIRYSDRFSSQNGTNVNFVQLLPDHLEVRTYERGVEAETLSCGTGVTAVGLVAGLMDYASPVKISTRGGQLEVSYEQENGTFKNIWLKGPVKYIYEGSIDLPVD